ncbi:hypothetical protein MLD38_000828 [Melastoma candidum]|uniref:Uncharacterized protein n=1 Tax=Melastoma candidum TaxID=119954 RepID=A0ACB9SJY6_9MYRT|nr:hypothetical protein MLD38_000828 [Melastoma candidum]
MEGVVRCPANNIPLSPIGFLQRASLVYADRLSLVYGDSLRFTWGETYRRCLILASALDSLGVSRGHVVAAFAPNVPAMYELHFAVPMAGAVFCTLNTRLNAATVAVLLRHSDTKVVFVDEQFLAVVIEAFKVMSRRGEKLPQLVTICDKDRPPSEIDRGLDYEGLLASGDPEFEIRHPRDETDPISLNYTSGTTSSPKGVVYSHRGAYLNSLVAALLNEMISMPVYLWTVPMFHCNGWCLTWAIAALGGTNICLRNVTAGGIFDNIVKHRVTHMSGAPTVLNMIANAPPSVQKPLPGKVSIMTGGAAPPPQVLFSMEAMGFNVMHSYGLTETYGPATVCTWKPEWNSLPPDTRARIKARQGLHHIALAEVDIKDPVTMKSVPADAKTMGEVMLRGNTIMEGYLKDENATRAAFEGGWFRTGDLAIRHPDYYIELKDRSKDIIISGGENISTIEVEAVLFSHPDILEAAVVGRPDDYWGETPCAFVKLKDGRGPVTEAQIIGYCREKLPHFMAPRTVIFSDLPKTLTGKTQKFVLRERAKALGSLPRTASRL